MITTARRSVAASTGLVLVLFILSGLSLPAQPTHASAASGAPAPAGANAPTPSVGASMSADTLLPIGQGAPDRRALPPPPIGYKVYEPVIMR
jgi:hypothetical protein